MYPFSKPAFLSQACWPFNTERSSPGSIYANQTNVKLSLTLDVVMQHFLWLHTTWSVTSSAQFVMHIPATPSYSFYILLSHQYNPELKLNSEFYLK